MFDECWNYVCCQKMLSTASRLIQNERFSVLFISIVLTVNCPYPTSTAHTAAFDSIKSVVAIHISLDSKPQLHIK